MPARDLPVYINCRDRLTDLARLVEWLEAAGHHRIVLLDNQSTYPPLLAYLRGTPHEVIRLPGNYGSRALWYANLVPDETFAYTDPDILPVNACPANALDHLASVLDRHPHVTKVGLGLHTDDLPTGHRVLEWETGPVIRGSVVEPGVYASLVDTTLAVYRPHAPFELQALRTMWPYEARHASWYAENKPLTREDRYYLERALHGEQRDIDNQPTGVYGSSWAQATKDAQ